MKEKDLLAILQKGEDSRNQFKRRIDSNDSLAAEMVAFSNAQGGTIFIGITDDNEIAGLDREELHALNQTISNLATHNVRPPIFPETENIQTESGVVVALHIPVGYAKPYTDQKGRLWVKCGSDKRQVSSIPYMRKLFQDAGIVFADSVPVPNSSVEDISQDKVRQYFDGAYPDSTDTVSEILENMEFLQGGQLTLAALLLFCRNPQKHKPTVLVKAVTFPGTTRDALTYLDSEDFGGTIVDQFRGGFSFILRNLRKIPSAPGFNSQATPEISPAAIEEALVNALVHRDYFEPSEVRIFIFSDRVEIISPGALSESLDIRAISLGATRHRNPKIAQYAVKLIPYRGLGTGIARILKECPNAHFENDKKLNAFRVVLPRKARQQSACVLTDSQYAEYEPLPKNIRKLLACFRGEMSRAEIMDLLGMHSASVFLTRYLKPALIGNWIERTLPDKPKSGKQRYRLTEKGIFYKNGIDDHLL